MLPNWQQKPLHKRENKREGSHMENPSSIVLREVLMSDLPIFFDQQLDPEANWMAAFTRKDPSYASAVAKLWSFQQTSMSD
jgi:hypothetical protein